MTETMLAPRSGSISLCGVDIDLLNADEMVSIVSERLKAVRSGSRGPLAVVSANLDHIHHFGTGSRWHGTLQPRRSRDGEPEVRWLTVLDGAPLVKQVKRVTGEDWPRLAGSDMIGPILDEAEQADARVGFLGGSAETADELRARLSSDRPRLRVAGIWTPERNELSDPLASRSLAEEIANERVDVLVVGLGKPRQEIWIAEYGARTNARVLLAFGAVVDFLAGKVERAPEAISRFGFEWAWRLALEPKRLARRYLLDGPIAYRALRRSDGRGLSDDHTFETLVPAPRATTMSRTGAFVGPDEDADVVVVVVTYNSVGDVPALISSLRGEARNARIRLVVVDNDSTDGTVRELRKNGDVVVVPGGANRGYAGGINAAHEHLGGASTILILNPDLVVAPGTVHALLRRMETTGADVVVPLILDANGRPYPSIRREPTVLSSFGDAIFGSRFARRPASLSELDYEPESYSYPHRIAWATGAALLVRRSMAEGLGHWDERFFLYCEETDYFRRAREAGARVWFEPGAVVRHRQGGSGSSADLTALLAVNRVRYALKHGSAAHSIGVRAAGVLHELLRVHSSEHRHALRILLSERRWSALPSADVSVTDDPDAGADIPEGAIIIPAHNEAAVIERTLDSLAPLAQTEHVDVIVACNGCTDDTRERAAQYNGVRVIEVPVASKVAAMNAADNVTVRWPRLYLDADVEITPAAVGAVFRALASGGTLSARPVYRYDTTGAAGLVRSYYRARARMTSARRALWGAGAYALSEEGHGRLGRFPAVTADDLWVDALFSDGEKRILDTDPVLVRTPRDVDGLMAILIRTYRGNDESGIASTSEQSFRELFRSVRGIRSGVDAAVYGGFALAGRFARVTRGRRSAWERDDSSRSAAS